MLRRSQFGLLGLLATFAIVAILPMLLVRPCIERRNAVRAIEDAGGRIGWKGIGGLEPRRHSWIPAAIWPPVEWVSFVDVDLNDDVWRQLHRIRGLEDLYISSEQSDDTCWRHLGGLTGLKVLGIHDVTDSVFSEVGRLRGLQSLTLSGDRVDGARISCLKGLRELRVLDLSDTRIDDNALKTIGEIGSLEELYLVRTSITDSGIRSLAGLTKLKVLSLNETDITDAGLKPISAIESLRSLHLDCIGVTNDGVRELDNLQDLETLEVSSLWIDESGTPELQASFPNCTLKALMSLERPSRPVCTEDVSAFCDPQARVVTVMGFGNMEARAKAVDQLSRLEQQVSDEAIGPLIKILTDPGEDSDIRSRAAYALSRFQEESAVQALKEALLDKHLSLLVKSSVAIAIGKTRHETAPRVLLEAFDKTAGTSEKAKCVRRDIVFGLGHTRRKETVQPLLAILNDPENSDRLRAAAAVSLGRTADKTAIKRLLSVARDETVSGKMRNAAAMGLVLSGDPAGLDYVFSALSEGPDWHIYGCALAIGQIRDRHAVPRLIEALKHPSFDVRYCAVVALGKLQDPRATGALEELLSEENEDLRCRIRQSLANIEGTLEWQQMTLTGTDWRLGETEYEVLGPFGIQ